MHFTTDTGESAQVDFTGQQFQLIYLTGPVYGVVDVYVDGVMVASLDQYNANWAFQATWTSDLFSSGDHSLRLGNPGGDLINIDAIEVIP